MKKRVLTILLSITLAISLPGPAYASADTSVLETVSEESVAESADTSNTPDAETTDSVDEEGYAVEPEKADWDEPPLPEDEEIEITEDEAEQYPADEDDTYLSAASDTNTEIGIMQALCKKIRTAIIKGTLKVDLSGYHLNRNTVEQISRISRYCPYFDGKNISGTMYYSGNYYSYLKITNNLSSAASRAWVNKIDTKLAEIYTLLNDSSLSVVDTALKLHDYMASHYYYDTTYSNYYPGIMLTENNGVCQSYAYLFQYIINTKGIECYTTRTGTHAWNILYVDDEYYNIDVTWDDPVSDDYGQAGHKYFMISDEKLLSLDTKGSHSGRNLTNMVCTDTSYEDDYLTEALSPIIMVDNDRYYINKTSLIKYNVDAGTKEELDTLGIWPVWGDSGYWVGAFSGLSEYESCLYYNTAEAIKYYDLTDQQVYTYSIPDTSNGYIYGSVFYGNQLRYSLQQDTSVAYALKNIKKTTLACSYPVWNKGVVTSDSTCLVKGNRTYTCIKCGETKTETLALGSHSNVTDTAVAATVFSKGKTAGTHCLVCHKVFTAQKTIAKLKPTIKLSKKSVTLKRKKSIKIKVSSLAKGDSIKYWKTSNKKVASITGTGVIKGVKKGKATITVMLKSGKKGTIKVTVK